MAQSPCPECQAILQELLELVELSRRAGPGPGATPQQLIAWFEQRDIDDDYKNRIRPSLHNVRRRMIDHQEATGHEVGLPLPPGRIVNLN